jgi:CRP/FNR family cyclic AMP-dependent transcriptional regulator
VRYGLLDPLSEPERRRVLATMRRRRFARDDVLFWAGDPGDSLHLVASGHVAAQTTTPRGDVATVRILGPGEHFGELAVVSPGPRSATVRALDAVETLVLHHDDFHELLQSVPIKDALVTALAVEVRRLAQALTDALYLSAGDHLWKRLAAVERAFADTKDETVLPVSQSMLATLAGVTRQTANKFLDDAEVAGVIRRDARGRITVVDRPGLQARAELR